MKDILLSNFKEIVLESARSASDEKIRLQKEKTKTLLEELDDSERENMRLKKLFAEIEEKYRAMAGKAENEAKRELINQRDILKRELHDLLLKRLEKFSASEEYRSYLKNKAIEAVKIARGNDILAEIRECDRDILEGIVRECKISESISGGARFVISALGIIVDNTLESAADDVMADFHEIKIS